MTIDELNKRVEELNKRAEELSQQKLNDELKKCREELIQLKKEGKIGWNEFLLSDISFFSISYIEWLAGYEPNEENAKNFITSDETIPYHLKEYGLITENEFLLCNTGFHEEYLAWLNGRKPTEETAGEFKKSKEELIQLKKKGKIAGTSSFCPIASLFPPLTSNGLQDMSRTM